MRTLDFLRRKSREQDFPLQVAGAGLLTVLGGPLVVAPVAAYVAFDAATSFLSGAPRALRNAIGSATRAAEESRRVRIERERAAAHRAAEEEERMRRTIDDRERERALAVTTIDARSEVIRFYESHRRFLQAAMPPSLFRVQLQLRFPETLSRSAAWEAARDMIGEMLPAVTEGRQRAEREDEEARRQASELRVKRRELRRLEAELAEWLHNDADPDLRDLRDGEIRSLRSQIQNLQRELEELEDNAFGVPQ